MNRNKNLKAIIFGVIILLIIMITTTPSHERFDKWVLQKHEISCEFDAYLGSICYKNEELIDFRSSHFRGAGLFASYEQNYRYENGERETFRTFGILGMLFKMKEGVLWEILN